MASIQLSIADPCHEDWNNMLPEERGRFCLSCQKTVVDFRGMTDGQVFNYFKNYKGSTCGQFAPEQLNRNITKPATHSIGRWKYFWQMLLPAVFTFYRSEAQHLKGKVVPLTVCKPDTVKQQRIVLGRIGIRQPAPKYVLQGIIRDEKEEPVPGTTIISESGRQTMADNKGHYSIEILTGKSLTISSIGYETKTLAYDSIFPKAVKKIEVNKDKNIILVTADIQLKTTSGSLPEVVVGSGTIRGRMVMGATSRVTITRLFQKKDTLTTSLPALKIFPNPLQPGQSFQISLQVKKTGTYLLRITDVAGKMILEEKMNVISKNQTEIIAGNVLQQRGIYLVNISNSADRKDKGLTGKLVIQ